MDEFISFFHLCSEICIRNLMGLFFFLYVAIIICIGIFLKKRIYSLAAPKEDVLDIEAENIARLIALVFVIGAVLMGALLVFDYHSHSMAVIDQKLKEGASPSLVAKMGGFLGTFGDFFGGFANPVLTFGTLIALAVTIFLQRIQLRDSRNEASQERDHAYIQAFETTFFNLLNLHTENLKNLSFDPSILPNRNEIFMMRVTSTTQRPPPRPIVFGRQVFTEVLRVTAAGAADGSTQLELYRWLQKNHNHILGHYFRHLYQILNLVDKLNVDGDEQKRYEIRKRYTNFLRAQLSSHELAVLYLNCTFKTVDDGKFRKLIIWYKILEHLPVDLNLTGELIISNVNSDDQWIFFEYFDCNPDDSSKWLSGAFGKNPGIKRFLMAQGNQWNGPVPWLPNLSNSDIGAATKNNTKRLKV